MKTLKSKNETKKEKKRWEKKRKNKIKQNPTSPTRPWLIGSTGAEYFETKIRTPIVRDHDCHAEKKKGKETGRTGTDKETVASIPSFAEFQILYS